MGRRVRTSSDVDLWRKDFRRRLMAEHDDEGFVAEVMDEVEWEIDLYGEPDEDSQALIECTVPVRVHNTREARRRG